MNSGDEETRASIKWLVFLHFNKINKPTLHISPRKLRPNFVANVQPLRSLG